MATSAAKRYAQAVISLAKERGTLDAWLSDLQRLHDLMSDPQAARLFADPNVTLAAKEHLLDSVLADAQPETRNFVRLLTERDRLPLIPTIFQIFADARRAEQGIAIADVTTAEPLTLRDQERIRQQLSQLVGKQIELRLQTDPQIIGGIIARIGDQLIDGSVITRLRRLRSRLVNA